MEKDVATITAELADREAIRDCLHRYCRAIDRADEALLLSAYWPDAHDEHGNFTATSSQQIADKIMPILKTIDVTTHVLHNITIDIDGDRANTEAYVHAHHRLKKADGAFYDHVSHSRFLDRFEKRDGKWRIKNRAVVRDWFREYPDSGDWGHNAMGKELGLGKSKPIDLGQHKPNDMSYAWFAKR